MCAVPKLWVKAFAFTPTHLQKTAHWLKGGEGDQAFTTTI
jgi:hypothetical protein